MTDLIIFGTGKIAQVLYSFLKKENNIVAFTMDRNKMDEKTFFDIPIIPFDEIQDFYPPEQYKMLVSVGYLRMNKFREEKCIEAKQKGYDLINYIHSSVEWHDNIEIGENNIIMDHVSIQPFVKIGNNNFCWSNSVVAHHSIVENNCWITSGVTISGGTTIKSNAFLGVNASIGNKITIERENFIGANTLISKNTKEKEVFVSRDGEKFKLDSERFLLFTEV